LTNNFRLCRIFIFRCTGNILTILCAHAAIRSRRYVCRKAPSEPSRTSLTPATAHCRSLVRKATSSSVLTGMGGRSICNSAMMRLDRVAIDTENLPAAARLAQRFPSSLGKPGHAARPDRQDKAGLRHAGNLHGRHFRAGRRHRSERQRTRPPRSATAKIRNRRQSVRVCWPRIGT
jgi:hypothetical protein